MTRIMLVDYNVDEALLNKSISKYELYWSVHGKFIKHVF